MFSTWYHNAYRVYSYPATVPRLHCRTKYPITDHLVFRCMLVSYLWVYVTSVGTRRASWGTGIDWLRVGRRGKKSSILKMVYCLST